MDLLKEFNGRQRKVIFLILLLSILAGILGFFFDLIQEDEYLERLKRPASYEEEQVTSLILSFEEGEEDLAYQGILGEEELSEEEVRKKMDEAFRFVEENMFREGEDKDHVRTGITIPDSLEENPVSISWEAEFGEFFSENGDIEAEMADQLPKKMKLLIRAEYREVEEVREYPIRLLPLELTEEERVRRTLQKELDESLKSSKEEWAHLPKKVLEKEILYRIPKKERAPLVTGLGILAVFSAYFYFKNENDKKKEKRERELKEAYPYFVGRFTILLGAGLNLLGIWKKLAEGDNFNESLRSEIRMTLWELGNGKTEREAYENFGKRIGGIQYQKFVSILNESLKMGSSQILTRLTAEAREAMLDRKNRVKEIGEVTGTKFLMPMMLELVLIMLIIMIPAMMASKG